MIPYKHELLTDFSIEENRLAYKRALKTVESELGKEYPLIIGNERITTKQKMTSMNPAKKEQIIGIVSKADKPLVEKAMDIATATFQTWKKVDPQVRAEILFKAAAICRRRKFELAAWLTYEAGKPWAQADGDVAEGIDFLEYYGRQMLELKQGKKLAQADGHINRYEYIPLGVGVIISPWNFPFAIMVGTTVAAIVTGNTVLLKPASNTPIIAYKFMEILKEAGLPTGVVNFIPGSGADIGDYLVDHPKTRFISFTGSKDVGIRINERAAVLQKGQIWMKRVIAEMGGKDTIIVDDDADFELAAQSIVSSAFGFSGQKCSACSRAVIVGDAYDVILSRLIELTNNLIVGDPVNVETFVGPVIDEQAFKKIAHYIEIGKSEGKLVAGATSDQKTGYFIHPTIFADVDPNARIMQEEIFGPVLAVTKAESFNEAIEIANNTQYGLTGAVISNNRFHLEQARADFHVGNLYFNRGCTAAIVGYQPFGGFNMSGTDSKAGGPDYLTLHMQAKTISELL